MKISKFSNDLKSASIHTNDMAVQPGPSKVFSERLRVDASRTIVGGYSKSRLGQGFSTYTRARPSFNRPTADNSDTAASSRQSRQEINASSKVPPRQFIEPVKREHNPYG